MSISIGARLIRRITDKPVFASYVGTIKESIYAVMNLISDFTFITTHFMLIIEKLLEICVEASDIDAETCV